jgi:hypothetical protein
MPEATDRDRLFAKLSDAEIARLARRGERRPIRRGEVLCELGAARMDFYVVLS